MKKIWIPCLLLVLVAACKKNDNSNTNNNNSNTFTSARAAMNTVAPIAKTVTIDAATGGSFYGNSGTRYTFPASAFISANGSLVTGNVQLQATEYLNKS